MHGYCSDITRMFSRGRARPPRCATPTRCSSKHRKPACAPPPSARACEAVDAATRARDRRRRLRRVLRAPHRSRHRRRGARGPVRRRRATRTPLVPGHAFSIEPGHLRPGPLRSAARGHRRRDRRPGPSASTTRRATSRSSTERPRDATRPRDGAGAVGHRRPAVLLGHDPPPRGRASATAGCCGSRSARWRSSA